MLLDIEALWPHFGQPVHWFAKLAKTVYGGKAESPLDLTRIVQNCNEVDGQCYVHINSVSTDALKGCARDVVVWKNVLIDIDPVQAGARPMRVVEEVMEELYGVWGESARPATSVLDSGRGMQIWLRIADADVVDDLSRRRIEASTAMLLRSLQPFAEEFGCVVDTSCSDLSRVARVPGNVNVKTGKQAKLIWEAREGIPASLFLHQYKAIVPPSRPTKADFTTSWNLAKALPHLTVRAADFIVSGVAEPGRRQAAFAAAVSLAEAGVPKELAHSWVHRGARLCVPPLTPGDTERAYDNAWRKHEAA